MASDLDTARATIDGLMTSLGTSAQIARENVKFDPPETGVWFRPVIIFGETFISTKPGRSTITGIVQISVYVPSDTPGMGTMITACDGVRDLINRIESSGVRFNAPSGPQPAREEETRWIERVIDVDFTVDEIVT